MTTAYQPWHKKITVSCAKCGAAYTEPRRNISAAIAALARHQRENSEHKGEIRTERICPGLPGEV